jgi:P-type Ca2+ transporter type 2C
VAPFQEGFESPTEANLLPSAFCLLQQLDLNTITGLSEQEAAYRLKREGYNELPSSKQRSILTIASEVLQEPIFLLFVACGAIYIFLGEAQDALILLGFVFFIMGITLYQEHKTERALEVLRDLSSPRALVIRDGKQKRIAGREVVRGDILVLTEAMSGDKPLRVYASPLMPYFYLLLT